MSRLALSTLLGFAAMLLSFAALFGGAEAAEKARPAVKRQAAQVFLFRGFAGVFSTGLDGMAAELRKRGIDAEVYGHLGGGAAHAKILQLRKEGRGPRRVILVGHSFGGNAALQLGSLLSTDNVRVNLVVTIDPTASGPLSPNVRRYINYYISHNALGAKLSDAGAGPSRIENIDIRTRSEIVGIGQNHWTMTLDPVLRKEIISAIIRAST